MNRTVGKFWIAPPCLMLLLAGCLSRSSAGEYDKSYTITGRATVNVHTNDGSVRVVTSDTKEVQFRVKYTGAITSGGGGPDFLIHTADGSIHIGPSQTVISATR